MQAKRILLFGGTGQIGQALQNQPLPPEWCLGAPTRAQADLTEPAAIAKAIRDFMPDLIINAAALTDIDACERDPDLARKINFEAVANIAAHAAMHNAPLVQLSTDYVFDGNDGAVPYAADAPMNPINNYGESKMLGEEAARHALHWHVILRISLVFSSYGENILTKSLRQLDRQEPLTAVRDQVASPTCADATAAALVTISNAILGGKADGFGTFHLTGTLAVSRAEFAQAIIDAYTPYSGTAPALIPVNAADIVGRVPRPAYSVLDNTKIERVYGITPRDWRDDLAASFKAFMEKKHE